MKYTEMIEVILIGFILVGVFVIAARMGDIKDYSRKDNALLVKIEKHARKIVLFTEMYPEWIIGASDPKDGLKLPVAPISK